MQHLHSPWQTCRGPCRVSLRVSVSLIMYHNARTTSPRCCQENFLFTYSRICLLCIPAFLVRLFVRSFVCLFVCSFVRSFVCLIASCLGRSLACSLACFAWLFVCLVDHVSPLCSFALPFSSWSALVYFIVFL